MSRSAVLSSPANPLLKDIRSALRGGTLTEEGFWVAETLRLVEESERSACRVKRVLVVESKQDFFAERFPRLADRVIVVRDELLASLATTETPQGILGLIEPPRWTLQDVLAGKGPVVVLDGVQDPGNAGAIARSAEAFGASGMCFLKGSVSPFGTKILRSSAGSLFRLPFVHGAGAAAVRAALLESGRRIFRAMPHSGAIPEYAELGVRIALIVGGESQGVGATFESDSGIAIPTETVESLNAATAAAVLLYEAHRQRSRRP